MVKNRMLSAIMSLSIVVLIITFSISLPICIRSFYYTQIDILDLPEITGYSKSTIINAYDEVMNYLTSPNNKFGVGEFSYSKEGQSHFEDCKFLINLNFAFLVGSFTIVLFLFILHKKKLITFAKPFGMSLSFLSGLVVIALFLTIGIFVLIDFQGCFIVFHKIFFPGKENWIFDAETDPIIRILPREFFLNCAALIIFTAFFIAIILILHGLITKKRLADKTSNI